MASCSTEISFGNGSAPCRPEYGRGILARVARHATTLAHAATAERSFADRLAVTGLPLSETDLLKLQTLVNDMERGAALLRDPAPMPMNRLTLSIFQ